MYCKGKKWNYTNDNDHYIVAGSMIHHHFDLLDSRLFLSEEREDTKGYLNQNQAGIKMTRIIAGFQFTSAKKQ